MDIHVEEREMVSMLQLRLDFSFCSKQTVLPILQEPKRQSYPVEFNLKVCKIVFPAYVHSFHEKLQ